MPPLNNSEMKEIESLVIRGAGSSFSATDFRLMQSPGVYVLMRSNECLYVGVGKNALGRISATGHHRLISMRKCDRILLWPCKSLQDAERLEDILIFRLKPRDNRRKTSKRARQILGSSWNDIQKYLNHDTISQVESCT